MNITFEVFEREEGYLIDMQRCQACECYFFKNEKCTLCPECEEKNKNGVGLIRGYIEKLRRR